MRITFLCCKLCHVKRLNEDSDGQSHCILKCCFTFLVILLEVWYCCLWGRSTNMSHWADICRYTYSGLYKKISHFCNHKVCTVNLELLDRSPTYLYHMHEILLINYQLHVWWQCKNSGTYKNIFVSPGTLVKMCYCVLNLKQMLIGVMLFKHAVQLHYVIWCWMRWKNDHES